MENLKLLFQLYVRPATTMSDIMDRGSWPVAALMVLIVAGAFYTAVNSKLHAAYSLPAVGDYGAIADLESPEAAAEIERLRRNYETALAARKQIPIVGDRLLQFFSFEPTAFYHPVISLSIFYVPFVILLMSIIGGVGSFGLVVQRDYGTLATCTLLSWTAAHLPFAIAGILMYSAAVDPAIYFWMWVASGLLFGVFMVFAVRTVLGADYVKAVPVVAVSWISLSAGMYVSQYVSPWLLSPFLLFWAFIYFGGYLGGEVRGFGNAFRQHQNLKRFLHNATVNPKDADAHVQLGLIYQRRRQDAKALEHLNKAIEIDPEEIDANYQLGKIARAKGELQQALDHFAIVVEQDDKYSLNEIWREIGATYMSADMNNEAADALEKYVERRPVDPEGLYYLGKVLEETGQIDRAKRMFEQAIESVKIAPSFRQHELRKWSKLAEKEL
ncbi:MAG TPA: tetratricopeptide repeat protein [Pyrinomonadaceae bacterium]|nr:tetratricopeptide repeat protein [Pyrinomonadaceae bacterium]